MLTADKVQNYKDFMTHHYGKHDRSEELHYYFHTWFEELEVSAKTLERYIAILESQHVYHPTT